MDEHPRHSRAEKKSGSSSRSPSLSRRPSLKDKKAPGTIVKVKGKKSSASSSKKERWLLTRKTWRYMSDAVGNLLPESHRTGSTSTVPAAGPSTSTTGRRTSTTGTTSEIPVGGSHIIQGVAVADIPVEGLPITRPKSTSSSTATSPTYGGVMSFPSHRPGVTPTGPGPGKFFSPSQSQQQVLIATDKFYPPSDDIPTLEKHFDAVCSKEKRFLLWTRTKPKGPAGPALRELKKQRKDLKSKTGKPGETFGHRDSAGSIFEALQMRLQHGSSATTGGSTVASNKENILVGEYNSPTTEEDDDDYDEYDDSDEITVRERRKSSTASSTSMAGMGQCWTQGSLTFFRPLSTLSSHGSESSYSLIVNPQGVTKICRNTGTQTDPFPEELLIRFRLQAVEEERQQQSLRQASPHNQSDATTVNSLMSPVRLDTMHKVSSPPPPTTTASSPLSPTTSTDGMGRASSGSGRESEEKLLETGSSARPSISGQSESMTTTKSGEGTSTTATATDKKSEESGYSSSISDTVMRYLRMVRKNSKADNKDTIDKFKTVNYDRSLRYIKSKNVTVEEALEHEKNKQQQAAQTQKSPETAEPQKQQQKIASAAGTVGQAEPAATVVSIDEPTNTAGASLTQTSMTTEKAMSPTQDLTKRKSSIVSGKGAVSSGAQSPTSPSASTFPDFFLASGKVDTIASGTAQEQFKKEATQGTFIDSDIPPPPLSPPAVHSPPLSPSALSSISQSPESGFSPPQQDQVQQQKMPASIGIQAGESLVHFLRSLNLNPMARKMSDFSSSCCSSDSPADVFSPRYSFAANVVSGSASDAEMFGGSGGGGVQQTAMASMMAMAAASGPQYEGTEQSIPQLPSDAEGASEYEDVFQGMRSSFFPKQSQSQSQSGPLSSSWSSSATTTQAGETAIKKSPSSSSSYSFSQLFHYKPLQRSRDHTTVGLSPETTSTPATPTTSSIGGSSGGLMKSFFGSSPFSSTFGLKKSSFRKPTSTTSLTITTNTGSDSTSGRVNAPPPTTSSSPNLLSLIHSSAASASTGFSNLFSSRGVGGGSGSSVTCTNTSRTGEFQQNLVSSAASSSGELRAQEASGTPLYAPLYSRSSLPICGESGKTSAGLVDGNYHHHHPQHVFLGSGRSGGSIFMARGLSDLIFSHSGNTTTARKGSSTRYVDLYLTPSGAMQKSKSSSSVLPLYGSSASVSGPPGASSSAAQLRVSPSSSIGGGGSGDVVAASSTEQLVGGAASSSSGSRLISKSKLFKSRSKSSTRVATSSSGSAVCSWSPQGRCKWKSVSGKVVVLEPTTILNLSEVERQTLQDVALEKLRALNLGVEIKIPKEKVGAGQQKPKRRPYLLKKKALSTGFFESGSKREEAKESAGGGSGLVFGVSLNQCVINDRLRQMKSAAAASTALASSMTDWEQQQTSQSHTHSKRSQNGSRNSVSSVFEMPKEDPFVPPQTACVPAVVMACINHLETYGLHTTGIFRVSTSLKRIRQLREDIDSGKEIKFGEDHSPHDIAALLKEYLRDLPEPLLCRDLYQAFLKTQTFDLLEIRNRKLQLEAIQHLVQLLPVSNRDTLAALLQLFAKVVANCSESRSKTGEIVPGNKMEGYSLATLIAPNILPCMPTEGANANPSTIDQNSPLTKERRESIDLVNYMISNFSAIFEVTPELLHDVYLHMMDTNPEAIEGILRLRSGPAEEGVDELETTSSVFEESEGGEAMDQEDTMKATTTRIFRRREDILHEGAGKGGGEEKRTRERIKERRDEHIPSITQSSGVASDAEKQTQSGGESDSSVGTRSTTSRWFRRSRGDTKGRTSSDSGSEKVKVSSRKREVALFETKRASSLDSVNMPEAAASVSTQALLVSPRRNVVTDSIPNRPLSGSDQSLRVPDTFLNTRRQSSPILESSGIITASLKIPVPVPLNIDDSDIPFIEDDNSGDGAMAHPYHHYQMHHQQTQPATHHQAYLQYHQQPPLVHKYQPQSQFQYSHQPYQSSQPAYSTQNPDLNLTSTDVVRGRSMSTDSSIPMKTTSTTTTPISSPARQPSSEVSSPASFSPPTSPPLYGTFPVEEMTARMFIGSAASSTQSTVLSTSPSMQQFHHRGAVTMTTPSTTTHSYPTVSTVTKAAVPKDSYGESRSTSSTPITRPKIEKGPLGTASSSGNLAASPSSIVVSSVSRAPIVSSSHLTLGTIPSSSSSSFSTSVASGTLSVPIQKPSEMTSKSAPPSPQPSTSAFVCSQTSSGHPSPYSQASQGTSSQQQTATPSSVMIQPAAEPKGLGKETKGANIGGLNKSKTADFEKMGTTKSASAAESGDVHSSSASGTFVTSTTPSYGGSHHQIYSIAPKMRLRSQENVLLKQQFLLRQQQHEMGESGSSRKERSSVKGRSDLPSTEEQHQTEESSSHAPKGGRPLTRRRIMGSASTSAILTNKPTSSTATGTSTQRVRSRDSETIEPTSLSSSLTQSSPSTSSVPSAGASRPDIAPSSSTVAISGTSPSRWKRSEIIASRQQSQPPSDPETFV